MADGCHARGGARAADRIPRPEVGLCSACAHARRQTGARGSEFWRCAAADSDPALLRYPPLPVERCRTFRAAAPERESP